MAKYERNMESSMNLSLVKNVLLKLINTDSSHTVYIWEQLNTLTSFFPVNVAIWKFLDLTHDNPLLIVR